MTLQAVLGGAALQVLRRHHHRVVAAVWAFLGAVTAAALLYSRWRMAGLFDGLAILCGTALALSASYFLTRHERLALLVAVSPLPGLLWTAPFVPLDKAADAGLAFATLYGFGFTAASLLAENRLARILKTGPGSAPWGVPLAATGLAAILGALVWHPVTRFAGIGAVLVLLSVVLIPPLASRFLNFDETFVVRANRARERRARWFEAAERFAEPRWGLSLGGIALILMVLSWQGFQSISISGKFWPLVASLSVLALLGGATGNGWREAAASALAGLAAFLFFLWMLALGHQKADAAVLLVLFVLYALAAAQGLWRVRVYRLKGEAPGAARARMLSEAGGLASGAAGALFAFVPFLLVATGAGFAMLGATLAVAAGGFLCPALVSGLEALVPRRQAFEELYGKQRPQHPGQV